MERLTIKPCICAIASTEYCEAQEDCYQCEHGRQMRKRLSDYEDTGLTPEQVENIKWKSAKHPPESFISVLVYIPAEEPLPQVREGYISDDGVWVAGGYRRDPGEVVKWRYMPEAPEAKGNG